MAYLRTQGILTVTTMRRNRIPNCELPSDFKQRGSMIEHVTNCQGIDFSIVAWKDTKMVILASTYLGSLVPLKGDETDPVEAKPIDRWNKKKKTKEPIPCPYSVHEYNKYMGGVDLMDASLGRYHINVQTKKWPTRLAYHFLSIAMVNSWILYKRAKMNNGVPLLPLHEFISEVASVLCQSGQVPRKRGRPTKRKADEPVVQAKKRNVVRPADDIRFDRTDHLPKSEKSSCRCQNAGCTSRAQTYCIKCRVHLCCKSDRDCFLEYHTQSSNAECDFEDLELI